MDLSLSANPQTLSLISCAPFSSTSSSLLSPPRFRSLRREFLGCGHNLRPPGLRSRRKCKKLGFHIQSLRFLFRASLDSQAIIVVGAVVTVSALTIVYLNYSKRKQNVKKMSGLSILALPERIRGIMNWVIMHDIFGTKDIERETSVSGNKDSMQQMGEFSHASEDQAVQLVMKEPALMHEETLITKTLECHGSEIIAPPVSDPISSRESEVAVLSFSPYVLSESGARQPVNCATEMPELEFEVCGQETEFGSDLHKLMVKEKLTVASVPMDSALAEVNEHKKANTEPCEESDTISYSGVFRESVREELYTFYEANQLTEFGSDVHKLTGKEKLTVASVPMDNAHAEVNEHKKVNTELGEDSDTISYSGVFRESVREDIYTFYEANQPAMKSVENLNHLNSLSSHASNRGSNIFSSPIRSSTTKGAELLVPKFLHTADRMLVPSENFEGKISLGLFKEGSPNKRKDSRKSGGFPRDKEKRILPQNGYRNLPRTPLPDGMHDDGGHHPSLKLSVYIRFLRDGRLIDCIELLEDMQRKGLLDMDKVYHAGFFRVCKSQKAVKEAFRFTKLIPNPALSTFNMLMSVCASSQDSEGAFQVLQLVQEAGLKADCKLYTTLISTCAKSGKVDAMFKVFHEMVNAKVEPNVHTYGALIDGCAKAGQVAKAFGAYGILRSKNVKPDRVVFNALIAACGQAGAVDRAFDVLAEMKAETQPIDPDHVTVGALIKACANAGQVDRAREVYNMIHEYNIKGTPEVYTIAVNSCGQIGDWVFACNVYSDMTRNGIVPDEMFLSALIDVAGHAGKVDAAFDILQAARNQGAHTGLILYSSLMGACSNAKNWQKALELYEDIKSIKLKPTVSTMNALITALCDGEQLQQAVDVLFEMKRVGLCPNTVTYSILLVASEKKDDLEVGLMLLSQAKKDGVAPNLVMCRCLIAMCLRRFERACTLGEPVLSFNPGRPQLDSKWTSLALMVYRETIAAGVVPTMEEFSQALGCLQIPHFSSLRERLIENLGVCTRTSRSSNLCSLVDGFGEYDPRAFSLLEEAASLGIVPCVSFKESPIVVDARKLPIHTAEVYLLTVLKGLKHRLAAGAKLPNITILLPIEKTQIQSPNREKTINVAGRISQAIAALLRRLGLPYLGNESFGKIRINGVVVKRWFQPKLASPFSGKPTELSSPLSRLSKGIIHQQRNIRTGNLSLE